MSGYRKILTLHRGSAVLNIFQHEQDPEKVCFQLLQDGAEKFLDVDNDADFVIVLKRIAHFLRNDS